MSIWFAGLTSLFMAPTYLTIVAALSSPMEWSCLAIAAVRPDAASSIFLSNRGEGDREGEPFLIVVVMEVGDEDEGDDTAGGVSGYHISIISSYAYITIMHTI
ncbi:MAG: hypothetical protein WAL46_07975 [Nitrososphaeraceae archaeon]